MKNCRRRQSCKQTRICHGTYSKAYTETAKRLRSTQPAGPLMEETLGSVHLCVPASTNCSRLETLLPTQCGKRVAICRLMCCSSRISIRCGAIDKAGSGK